MLMAVEEMLRYSMRVFHPAMEVKAKLLLYCYLPHPLTADSPEPEWNPGVPSAPVSESVSERNTEIRPRCNLDMVAVQCTGPF
jgi:hypothetical protein